MYNELEKILNLPSSRISSFTNLPQNSGKFGFRDIPKYRVFICGVERVFTMDLPD